MPDARGDLLGRLFDAHAAGLAMYARQFRGCDGAEADDLVQEAFLALARQSRLPDEPVAWLHRVVRNAALMAVRSSRRRQAREARTSRSEAEAEPWFATVDDQLDAGQASAQLAALDPETREAIVARLWGGLTFEQIAGLQECSTATVHRRYNAGLSRLQERLETPCHRTASTTP
ncbi:RNA polymerase sigma factor [Aquisphaera insulae]|uniref:RNA polymerase sigma factor n=1 Tax=Aquisphaera insulae TaxID=2712864 RepID=UPI0013EDF5FA|nr:sigma-70 family RNA polymerase sigma factor [Aquisphaera insulae]